MDTSSSSSRPLSPHLQIYKWQITMAMSILHRTTGVALTLGLFVMAWWLMAAASGPEAYDQFRRVASSPIGIVFLIGWSYALFYHTCTGIRHLVLDTGKMYAIPDVYKSGYTAFAASIVLTGAFWLAILM